MSETLSLIIGIVLLVVIIYDFFFTTLSISGAGFITRTVAAVSHLFLQFFVKIFGRTVYSYSGIITSLVVLFVWIAIVWLGLFFVFTSDTEAIVNSQGKVANVVERLYFTGYVLSTLGMGNFYPTTNLFETLSSLFSFFGFIFFTSSITYFLSVSTAIVNKRTLARTIQNLGKTPETIADKLLEIDTSYSLQLILTFQQLLDRHVVSHQAYPVVHYYSHPQAAVCLSINIVRLDEALSILLTSEKGLKIRSEACILRDSITAYLRHVDNNYSWSFPKGEGKVSSEPLTYTVTGMDSTQLEKRRNILIGLLRSEGYQWEDISPRNKAQKRSRRLQQS